jgi:hypothetical protein
VRPVQNEIFADQEQHHLRGERQRGERPVAVVVEGDQAVGRGDAEQQRGADDEQPDAQVTRDHRDKEPIAKIGDDIGLPPPRPARIAGPERGQHREDGGQRQRDPDVLGQRFANADEEREQFQAHAVGARCAVWRQKHVSIPA